MIDAAARTAVRIRAKHRCEYCLLPEELFEPRRFHVEHIVPRKHNGGGDLENLALACEWCNLHKGPNLTGIDQLTGNIVSLFHPRKDRWVDQFKVIAGVISGLTPVGRATVRVMDMNNQQRVELREEANVTAAK